MFLFSPHLYRRGRRSFLGRFEPPGCKEGNSKAWWSHMPSAQISAEESEGCRTPLPPIAGQCRMNSLTEHETQTGCMHQRLEHVFTKSPDICKTYNRGENKSWISMLHKHP